MACTKQITVLIFCHLVARVRMRRQSRKWRISAGARGGGRGRGAPAHTPPPAPPPAAPGAATSPDRPRGTCDHFYFFLQYILVEKIALI